MFLISVTEENHQKTINNFIFLCFSLFFRRNSYKKARLKFCKSVVVSSKCDFMVPSYVKTDCSKDKVWAEVLIFLVRADVVFGVVYRICSNYNTRGVNRREHFCFFGHSSLSHHAFLVRIGGNLPLSIPDLSKPMFLRSNRGKNKILRSTFSSEPPEAPRLLIF